MELDNLDNLAAQADAGAAELDAATAPGAPVAGELVPAGPDYAAEARAGVDMFAALVVGYAPKAEPLWNEGAKARVSMALAPVMEKYGMSFGAMPPEITLIVVAGPLLWQTSRIVAAQMQEERAKDRRAKADAAAKARPDPLTAATLAEPTGAPASAPAPAVHPQTALYDKA